MNALLISLSKRLLLLALDEAVRRSLPAIYKRLDAQLPLLITNNAPPGIVRGIIASAINDATGKRVKQDQVAAVIGLYDPVEAARNMLMNRR